jgi:hypothetical protein
MQIGSRRQRNLSLTTSIEGLTMTDFEPPSGWEREVPRYKATRPVHASPNPRHRLETPFSSLSDHSVWQHAEQGQEVAAGEEVTTKSWPHPSFRALNFSAGRVLDFFNSRQRSRMALSPWRNGRIELDDGLSGPLQPTLSVKTGAAA